MKRHCCVRGRHKSVVATGALTVLGHVCSVVCVARNALSATGSTSGDGSSYEAYRELPTNHVSCRGLDSCYSIGVVSGILIRWLLNGM